MPTKCMSNLLGLWPIYNKLFSAFFLPRVASESVKPHPMLFLV